MADGTQGHNIQIIAGWLDINGYTSSPTSINCLRAAVPIRLIEGSVVSPKNSGSGSPRKGNELSSESEAPMSS